MRSIPTSAAIAGLALIACQANAQPASADAAAAYTISGGTPAHIRSAVETPERSAEQRARDANRKPAEILTLAGIEEGDHVIEFAGFGQYYTTMLAEAVGPDGKVDVYGTRGGTDRAVFVFRKPSS